MQKLLIMFRYFSSISLISRGNKLGLDRIDYLFINSECPKPIIAATFGGNIGGAIDLLSACDIRLCSSDAWFTIKEVDIGLGEIIDLQHFFKFSYY